MSMFCYKPFKIIGFMCTGTIELVGKGFHSIKEKNTIKEWEFEAIQLVSDAFSFP